VLEFVEEDNGKTSCPFDEWLDDLLDVRGKALIEQAMDKFEAGLFGDSAPVGNGVWEHRIHYGPGYRIYYAEENLV
jgi:putative addiction module killer protein